MTCVWPEFESPLRKKKIPEVLEDFSVLRPVCFSVSAAKRKEHRLFAKEILQLRQFSDKFVSG